MGERKEAWMRIIVLIITGILLGLWRGLIQFITVIHWFIVLITGTRNKELAEFCESWNTQSYTFIRYLTFNSNKRPFPFSNLTKNINKYEK